MTYFLKWLSLWIATLYLVAVLISANAYSSPTSHQLKIFEPFAFNDEMPTKQISTNLQDQDGLMWIATWGNGIFISDGIKVVSLYEYFPKHENKLWSEFIQKIVTDKFGNIWIATSAGVNVFIKEKGKLERVSLNNDINTTQYIRNMGADHDGNIWFVLRGGSNIYKVNEKSLKAPEKVELYPKDYEATKSIAVRVRRAEKGFIWVFRNDDSVLKINTSSNQIVERHILDSANFDKLFINNPSLGIRLENGMSVFPKRDSLWIKDQNNIQKIKLSEHFSTNINTNIRDVASDHDNNILIAISSGIIEFNTEQNQFYHYQYANESKKDVKLSLVTNIKRDNFDNIWISSFSGLFLLSNLNQSIQHLQPSINNIPHYSKGSFALFKDNFGYFWSGDNGLNVFDAPESFNQELIKHFEDVLIRSIKSNKHGLWIGTLEKGLFHIDYNASKINSITHFKETAHTYILDLAFDSHEKLWIAGYYSGLSYFDTESRTHHKINQKPFNDQLINFAKQSVSAIRIDSKDNIWAGTQKSGLYKLSNDASIQSHFSLSENSSHVGSLFIDTNDTVWVGLEFAGAFEISNGQVIPLINKYPDLPSNIAQQSVWSITKDIYGAMWFTTDNTLYQLSPNGRIRKLNRDYRASLAAFNAHAMHPTELGELYIGSEKGVTRIKAGYSESLSNEVFSAIKPMIGAMFSDEINKEVSLYTSSQLKQRPINLSSQGNKIEFKLSSPLHSHPNSFEYLYKIEGFHNTWQKTSNKGHSIQFMNLPPGEYVLKAKLLNRTLPFEFDELEQTIIIHPAWFQTWWAKVLGILSFLFVGFLFVRYRFRQLANKANRLEGLVNERTNEINNLLKQKQLLFAKVSHEFRTPLTLILAPLEDLISHNELSAYNKQFKNMKVNANRLLRMVEQLLELAALENNAHLKRDFISVKLRLNVVVESFSSFARKQNIVINILPFEDLHLALIRDSFDKIFSNLLSNAIKYSNSDSSITISVISDAEQVQFKITDEGIGIAPSEQQKIFEHFTRGDSQQHSETPGTGIGLALVKELVIANNGSITLQSEVNAGSTFIVSFPVASAKPMTYAERNDSLQSNQTSLILEADYSTHQNIIAQTENNETSFSNKKTVLIIEDNAELRSYLRSTLQEYYLCFDAPNGEQGLRIAKEQIPDLIVCDVMMPGIDGYATAQELKSDVHTSHIPILMLTAKNDLNSRLKGWQSSIDEYMAKPFSNTELLYRIHNLLTVRDLLKKRFGSCLSNETPILNAEFIHNKDEKFILKFEKVIEENFTNPDFKRTDAAELMAIGERQLNRKLSALVDHNFNEYLRKFRLRKAKTYIGSQLQVSEVADMVGFANVTYFSTCFKAEFGESYKKFEDKSITNTERTC
jgi:signal transduction histidine kinase/ligand-binding sensor domain-containing protein/CheY-like chemotaxis protein/AraC-like DNA-binding protein